MSEMLGAEIWEMQRLIVESVRDNKRTAVRSCHGIGKSYISARIALWFLISFPDSVVFTTAPTFRQVEKILWQEIGKACANARVPLGIKPLQTEIKIAPGWYAFGFSADKGTNAQGLHAKHLLGIYDEAGGIAADAYEALEGAFTSQHTRLLQIGNPTDPTSPFAREFKTPGAAKFAISAIDSPNFTSLGITLEDCVTGAWEAKALKSEEGFTWPKPWLITPEWVADKVRRWGVNSPAFRSRVMAEFPDLGDDTLIPLAWLDKAQQLELSPTSKDKKRLAVDVARFGGDSTVLGVAHGPRYRTHKSGRGWDTMQTAGEIVRAMAVVGVNEVNIDEGGLGAGVVDRVRELKRRVNGMQAGGSPIDGDRFLNARAEWFWTLRERYEKGELDIDLRDEDLYGQLSNMKYKVDSRGRIIIESKADMKKRGLPSPDHADTQAMAYAARINPRAGSALIDAMSEA